MRSLTTVPFFRFGLPAALGAVLFTFVWAQPSLPAATFSDFSFGGGAPFGGCTTVAGVTVVLESTNTEPFGATSFRDNLLVASATVTFTFSREVEEFHLDVSFVRADEYLTGFNIGQPTSLSGTLVNNAGLITTSTNNDGGFGRLSWTGISTSVITFIVGADGSGAAPALALNQFGILPGTGLPLGGIYCDPANANSTGNPSSILVGGSPLVSDNDISLVACGLPTNQFGYFLASRQQGFTTNPGGSQGNLCLSGPIARFNLQIQSSGSSGTIGIPVDLSSIPLLGAVAPGETMNFQCWHRDVNGSSNFTNAVSVTFL